MKPQTLLEKAKAMPRKQRTRADVSDDELDLVIAMMRGEVTATQAGQVLGKLHRNTAQEAYSILKVGLLDGRIKIERVNKR